MQVYVFGFRQMETDCKLTKNWANFLKLIFQYFIEKKIIVQYARNKKVNTCENNKDNPLQVSAWDSIESDTKYCDVSFASCLIQVYPFECPLNIGLQWTV